MFTEELDRKLIKLVRNNPVLYDHNDFNYMDFNAREVVWQMIGDEMKRPATDCKQRWINIRDVNRRLLRKYLENPGSAKLYKYDQDLSFMRPFYKDVIINNAESISTKQEDISNDKDAEEYENDDHVAEDSDDTETEQREKKRKSKKSKASKKKIKKEAEIDNRPQTSFVDPSTSSIQLDPEDPVDSFLVSIGTVLKSLSPYHLNLAKTKIFSIVQEHDLQNILEKNGDNDVDSN